MSNLPGREEVRILHRFSDNDTGIPVDMWRRLKSVTDAYINRDLMTLDEAIDYLNGPDYELFLHEVEWCFISGVPRHAEPVSDWDRHQAADDASDAGRHGTMLLVSPSSLAAAVEENT